MLKYLILILSLLALTVAAWFGWTSFRTPEPYVFQSISVGDSEVELVDALTAKGIEFHKGHGDGLTVYSHTDGFLGVYFYFVENGRVVRKAFD